MIDYVEHPGTAFFGNHRKPSMLAGIHSIAANVMVFALVNKSCCGCPLRRCLCWLGQPAVGAAP
jgi:hypothetical protein